MKKTWHIFVRVFFMMCIVLIINHHKTVNLKVSPMTVENPTANRITEVNGLTESAQSVVHIEDQVMADKVVVPQVDIIGAKEQVEKKEDTMEVETKADAFEVLPIDEQLKEIMEGKSYQENDKISYEDLRVVKVIYFGYDSNDHKGELVVHKEIAQKILEIFKVLYDEKFPVESVKLVDYFEGDDDLSMKANNTSGFNFRVIPGTDRISNHSYGLAVDINPLVNPYVTKKGVFPSEGEAYVDRTLEAKGMIKAGDVCYNAFITRGFTWGGEWQNSKDYQHFEIKIEGINQ